MRQLALALVLSLALLPKTWAQVEVVETPQGSETAAPVTGKKAAQDYFNKRQKPPQGGSSNDRAPAASVSNKAHYLDLHIGTFIDEGSYTWGHNNKDDVGKLNAGVTYRVGEWVNSMDLLFRADFTSYELREGKALKLSVLPIIAFPDAKSAFPLYFGAGAGAGIFFKQIKDESVLALDYTILVGLRLFDLIENVGFMAEVGMKNHILLLSDGQYNGVFLNIGTVLAF